MNSKLISRCVDIALEVTNCDLKDRRVRHFAFIINKNKILSIGKNAQKTHPILKNNKYGYGWWSKLHAETSAVVRSKIFDHSNNKLLTFRLDKHDNINMGKPCSNCTRLIKDVNFKEVVYSDWWGKFLTL